MTGLADLLSEETVLLYFGLLALGAALGALKLRGIGLGPAAVLFGALAVSAWDERLALPPVLGQVGLALFAYTIGIQSGPAFFSSLRTGGRTLAMVAGVLLACAGVAWGLGRVVGLGPELVAGVYAGALTNTPALAAATEQLDSQDPTVGYSVTYLMGVLGMLGVAALALRQRVEAHGGSAVAEPPPKLTQSSVRVDEPGLPDLREIVTTSRGSIRFSRVMRDDEVLVATDDFVPRPGDVLTVIGPEDAVEQTIARIGHRSTVHLALDRKELDFRRIAVSNAAIAGRPLSELHLLDRFGATATRVRRGDVDLLATDDLVVHVGDRVRVTAPRTRMGEVARYLGDSERGASDLNPVGLMLGLAIGLAFGLIPIPLPGGRMFEFGLAGGPLLVGLVLGRLQRSGPILWSLPFGTSNTLGQYGMLAFLAYAGSNSGAKLVDALSSEVGPRLFLVGAAVTLTAGLGLLLLGPRVGHASGPVLAGVLAGSQTQPAVLAFANERATGDPRVNLGYALVYPMAMILKVVVAPLLGSIGT